MTEWRVEEVCCDYCGGWEAAILLTGRDLAHSLGGVFKVVKCSQCGLVRTIPQPTAESIMQAYPNSYGPHQARQRKEAAPKPTVRWALVNYRRYKLGKPWPGWLRILAWPIGAWVLFNRRCVGYVPFEGQGRLLDIGCGVGQYVAKMKAAGWDAQGLDVSASAVRIGRGAGLKMIQGTVPGADLPEGEFDIVSMWHVLEHVLSPKRTLIGVNKLLKPDGIMLVCCPRLDSLAARLFGTNWHGLELPRHLTHFTLASLKRYIENAGFRVEHCYGLRTPGSIRHSFRYAAEQTGSRWCRWLGKSRLLVGLLSHLAWALGKSSKMVILARKRAVVDLLVEDC